MKLTPKEQQVYTLLSQGKPTKVIAYDLGMAETTAKKHIQNMLAKAKAPNRITLILKIMSKEQQANARA